MRGQIVTGKGYDAIVILLTGTAWVIALRATRRGTVISIIPDYDAYTRWIFTRFGAGCLFLFLWQLRSTFVTYRRIESEEAREETISTQVLLMEQRMTTRLLHSLVPAKIANDLSRGLKVPPKMYDFACVFFSDICGFTQFAAIKSPLEVFAMLHRLFVVMDRCVSRFPALYKIETIGDAYMVVGGLNLLEDEDDAYESDARRHLDVCEEMAQFALLVREAVQLVPMDEISFVQVRMGIHTGPIVTGLSGGSMIPRFCCYGDTVNTASRMESTGVTNRIHLSSTFHDLTCKTPGAKNGLYILEPREPIEIKGKGRLQTYFLDTDTAAIRDQNAVVLADVEDLLKTCKDQEVYSLSSSGTISTTTTNHNSPASSFSLAKLDDQVAIDIDELVVGLGIETITCSFAQLVDPDFDVLQLEGNFDGICQAVATLMSGIVGSAGCSSITDPATLKRFKRFIRRVGLSYRNIPYHNWHHAMCVVQQTAANVMQLGLQDVLTEKERFVLMLTALVHDMDHPGNNNAMEVKKKSSLALLYNDQSVLENHHLALAFNIMANRSYNIFNGWDANDAADARKVTIACVLATDMDCHAALQDELQRRRHLPEGAFVFQHDAAAKDKLVLKKCILHVADIANPTRPFAISSKISMLAIDEFNQQTVAEAALGLPVTKHMVALDHDTKCKGEMFFLKSIARPYFEALGDCFPNHKECKARWLANIDNNFELWNAQIGNNKGK